MASADGSVVIDVQIPVDKVRTDSEQINHIINAIGSNSGDKLDQHFKQNTEKVKANASETSRDIDNKVNKDIKTNYKLDDHDATDKLKNIKDKIKDIPKDSKTNFQAEDHSSNVLDRIKNRLKGVNQEGKATSHTFRDMFLGSALGNLGSNLFSNAVSGFKRIVSEGMNLNKVTGGIVAQFKAMGLSEKQIGALTNQIGFLKTRIGATGSDIATVQKNMMNWSVIGRSGANRLTTALAGVSAAGRLNSQQFAQMSMQMMRVGSTGKVSLGSLSRIAKQVPNFYSMLARGAGMSEDKLKSLLATGDVTQKQFQTWLANSSKYADSAFKSYGQTQAGALAQMNGAWQKLEATMTQPLFNMKTSAMQQLATLMTKGAVPEGAKMLGEALRQVAFYGMDILKYIGQHKNDITAVAEDTVKIAGTLAKDVWNDFAGIVLDIGKSIGLINDNGKKSGDALHQLRIAMDNIAKNKNAIRYIADAIIAIAAVKGLGKTVGLLDEIATMKVGKNTVLEMLKGGINGKSLKGAFQSIQSAGGIKKLTPYGKATIGISVAANGVDIANKIHTAMTASDAKTREKATGEAIGEAIGTGIGAYKWGALGATIGGKIGAQSVSDFKKKWHDVEVSANVNLKTGKDERTPQEKANGSNHRQIAINPLNILTDPFHAGDHIDEYVSSLAQNMWGGITHLNDPKWYWRMPAGDNGLDKAADQQSNGFYDFLKSSGFLKWQSSNRKLEDNEFELPKNTPQNGLQKWWKKQTDSLAKQFKPITSAKIDWGWLDPKKNGLDKWLAGFTPQVHGKVPSLKNLQIKRSSILPDLHPIKWIEDQFRGFHWPKLPKWHIKFPNIHPIRWLKSKFKGFHLPHLKLRKPSLKGFNSFIGNLKKNAKNGFNEAKKRAGESVTGILKNIDHLKKKGKSNLDAFSSWIGKNWKNLKKNSAKTWDNIKDTVERNTRNAKKQGAENFEKLQKAISDTSKDIKKGWHNLWNGLASFFENVWKSIKRTASGGINGIVGVINGGISGIDNIIHSFGGKEHAIGLIPKVKLATGTLGNFTPSITKPTLALLNDGSDSPETGNRETIWDTKTGALGVVNGTNVPFLLQPGMEVFSASQSRDLGFTHFAKGTNPLKGIENFIGGLGSWISEKGQQLKKWFDLATKIVGHPLEALNDLFSFSDKGLKGIFAQLGKGMFDKSKDAAKDWWSQLWNMASSKLDGDGGPATGLLKAVEKYGEGHRYVWGAAGPTTFDCSGLVMYALKHAYGIDFPHFSGSQYGMTQHISKDQAKMGDLVFWGNHGDEHVGVYAGGNRYFSAESPSQGIHMNTLDSVVGKGKPLFGRVRGLSQKSDDKVSVKANSFIEKLIKSQVGNGFFKFLAKLGSLFGISSGEAGMPTGDHTHWMKQAHIPRSDWAGINYIVSAESGWNPHAVNPSSGTYGLGQMQGYNLHYYTKHGGKSNAIAQLMGIMDYIHDRYGSVANAVRFRKAHNWYGNGGITHGAELAVVGEDGVERIINVLKPSADALIDNTIQARAQVAPESPSGKLAKLIDLNAVRFSQANGYGTPASAKTKTVITKVGNNEQNSVDGDVYIDVHADSAKLARVIYPKVKILQGHDLDTADAGGAY